MQNMIFVLYPLFCILLPCMLYVLIQTKGFHQRTNFIHMIWVFIFVLCVPCSGNNRNRNHLESGRISIQTSGRDQSVYISVCQVPPQLPQIL